jgi:hypothetical protein
VEELEGGKRWFKHTAWIQVADNMILALNISNEATSEAPHFQQESDLVSVFNSAYARLRTNIREQKCDWGDACVF